MNVYELLINLPSKAQSQAAVDLSLAGFKGNETAIQNRHGDWTAVSKTGNELVTNQYHFSIYEPTGIMEEVSAISNFASGVTYYKMEVKTQVSRIPLREDSDTE